MFHDPLLLSFQGTTFVIEFLKLKKNLKKKNASITERITNRRIIELKKKREKCIILGMCGHMTVNFYFRC